jgi:hypothetical protein
LVSARARATALAALVVALFALSGCQVNTVISVRAQANGQGTVAVRVTMDQAAVQAVGGSSALAAQLDVSDLEAAGWKVSGPSPGPGSSTVISASHAYSTPVEAGQLIADLAGSGPAGSRPFKLSISRRSSFWHVYTDLAGTVNLTCGLNCFGDAGLQSSLGSPIGFNPAPLIAESHQDPSQVFSFVVNARLPGRVASTNASANDGGVLTWTPRLGQTLVLSATTQDLNWDHLIPVFVLAGMVLLALIVVGSLMWRSRRRRRKGGGDGPRAARSLRRGAHARTRRSIAKAVTSRS